jgi:elongation factor P
MIEVTALRKGTTYAEANAIFRVLSYTHTTMGRGGATIRVKVQNLRTGTILEKTYNNGDRVQDIRLEQRNAEYLYNDGDIYYFMDSETFEQPTIAKKLVTDIIPYLTENMAVELVYYEGEVIDIEIPTTVSLEVVRAERGFAGDTAQGATKQVTVSTGLIVRTPLFVNIGDTISIDTRTGEYLGRV